MSRAREPVRARIAALVAAAVAMLALGWAIPAVAGARTAQTARRVVHLRLGPLPGPSSVSLGLVDDELFVSSSGSYRAAWLDRAHALGARFVRLALDWSVIAPARYPPGFDPSDPSDPNYRWTTLDSAVQAASRSGEKLIVLVHGAPTWAEGPDMPAGLKPGVWEPNPAELGQFARALAARYSGRFRPSPGAPALPRVSYFQAWNEPNLPDYLMPQWIQGASGTWVADSPGLYREMLNDFYSAVKSVDPGDTVLAAGMAPYGDPPATGQGRMYPVTFLEQLMCLSPSLDPVGPCPDPPHFDVLDMHPYAIGPTVKARLPGDISVPDMDKIYRIVQAAQRFNLALPAGSKPLWVSEISWSDVPASAPTPASLTMQARFLALGFYELWRQGVSHIFWFQMRDPPPQPGLSPSAGAGLYFMDGAAKPSAAAYRFPFIAIPASRHGKITIWGRAPRAGSVLIQKLVGDHWRSVLLLVSTAGGIFYANHHLGSNLELRAVASGWISPVWATNGPM